MKRSDAENEKLKKIEEAIKSPAVIKIGSHREAVLKIDEINQTNQWISVTGWRFPQETTVEIESEKSITYDSKNILRDDVNEFLGISKGISLGFEIKIHAPSTKENKINIKIGIDDTHEKFPLPLKTCDARKPPKNPSKSKYSAGHIDFCGSIPSLFGIMSGWAISKKELPILIIDSNGNRRNLSEAIKYHRNDISEIFSEEYGKNTANSGFTINWPFATSPGDQIGLYEEDEGELRLIIKSTIKEINQDPVSYAKYAFQIPTPTELFHQRLEAWEGKAIESLIEAQQKKSKAEESESSEKTWEFGSTLSRAKHSIIIPLYGRWDFVEFQLSEFSKDNTFKESTEILYVIDDPKIVTPLINGAENLFETYRIPFKIIWGNRNRGFSGANNLGAKHAKGEFLILLNSDVFPTAPGWVEALCCSLEKNPDYGLIGAKLIYPDGGIQHAGMNFLFSKTWSAWLNKHPLAGVSPSLDSKHGLTECPAVTGACVAISAYDYSRLGGLDEGYLIGDFEDSDLCMKVNSAGMKIGYLPEVVLTHLERQSFSLLGEQSFRALIVRFNAWRHTKRWHAQIQNTMKRFQEN